MKRFLPLLILTGLLFGQEIAESQRIDALYQFEKLEEVEKQARVDAKEGLGSNVMLWSVTGLFHIFPVPFAWALPAKLPENRQKALLSLDAGYQPAYRLSKEKAVKKNSVLILLEKVAALYMVLFLYTLYKVVAGFFVNYLVI
jgi:hypothetical protein